MKKFVHTKTFDETSFMLYLQPAIDSNQYTNGGSTVELLERTARNILEICDSKAVIAVVNGSAALNAIINGIAVVENIYPRVITQDFTFYPAFQGECRNPIIVDFNSDINLPHVIDLMNLKQGNILLVTNCFGHVQELDTILAAAKANNLRVIFDNAATPYSFYKGINSCNYGNASFVSLHHTKPIGFGEGGLAIVDRKYEKAVRAAIAFGLVNGKGTKYGSNYKMSEISASAILQWWTNFSITAMAQEYVNNYEDYQEPFKMTHYGDRDKWFPSCMPAISNHYIESTNPEVKKYYTPLKGLPHSQTLYNNILCFPLGH